MSDLAIIMNMTSDLYNTLIVIHRNSLHVSLSSRKTFAVEGAIVGARFVALHPCLPTPVIESS